MRTQLAEVVQSAEVVLATQERNTGRDEVLKLTSLDDGGLISNNNAVSVGLISVQLSSCLC